MPLPTTGPINMMMVAAELGISATGLSLNDPRVRALAGKPTGPISLADLRGASAVTPQTYDLTTVGAQNFTVPAHNTITIELWGGGGGGRGLSAWDSPTGGGAGGASTITSLSLSAGGGSGSGSGGNATGGTANTKGNGANGNTGGTSPNATGNIGRGGGGASASMTVEGNNTLYTSGGGGGGGAYVRKQYTAGEIAVGAVLSVVAGNGGARGATSLSGASQAAAGNPGMVRIAIA